MCRRDCRQGRARIVAAITDAMGAVLKAKAAEAALNEVRSGEEGGGQGQSAPAKKAAAAPKQAAQEGEPGKEDREAFRQAQARVEGHRQEGRAESSGQEVAVMKKAALPTQAPQASAAAARKNDIR